ncbi:helix-turn-helix domain-containing protein [Xanthomonas arboricola]|uniref:helix-turn-helix domain-containing protein n=1 Tax=Xanthomonas arboricola TaxID=56448 RepID=UPI0002FD6E06|nr:LysR family transcriptional regulator [Xanthomonas arboricola]MDN0222070.1 LysR family transcriptional regulator [Xanthomonas arboricola pv. juglandis]MDN0226228.1 LysR family transcriptional regulator [Xanthomonas arboricola pv. juglandis]MDN0230565.1 LysR family transcriptional regulator [Xanthomonas arboricola pv. juglandis]MDN0234731.1 LysR family transcriptional regulator [Xanthomonas arboricola pv. juglandis]MDN0239057.1 LysR family transcriptional regulator [Xanthomonas arboricola pv
MNPSERVKGIDIFVSAADAGSFTAAAERLSLTSSAVGKAIHAWRRAWACACSRAPPGGWR